MKTLIFSILLLGLFACNSGPADTSTDDRETVTTSTPSPTEQDGDGDVEWEDQAARSEVTANSANYDGSPTRDYGKDKKDTLKYIQTPEIFSVSPVGDNPRPNQNMKKAEDEGSLYAPK